MWLIDIGPTILSARVLGSKQVLSYRRFDTKRNTSIKSVLLLKLSDTNHDISGICNKTISANMKGRQNHRKKKNVRKQFFEMRNILFLVSCFFWSTCFFQPSLVHGFKGLMPFPEGKTDKSIFVFSWV